MKNIQYKKRIIMKKLNKLVLGSCLALLGLLMLTGCEGSELYKVGAPSWLEGKLDSIANARTPDAGLYNVGSTALNSPFWTLGKSHVVPAGGKLEMLIDLTVNPDNKYFKNFYVVITNDVSINPRGSGYYEYGVMRFDNDLNKNSEWGTDDKTMFTKEDRQQNISANFTNTSGADEIDPSVQDMNGLVKVVVDRTGGGLIITFEGEKCKKTYTRAKLESHNLEATNENIRITLGVEGSFVNVIESNIDPVDDSIDRDPVSMTLKGVQKKYLVGTDMANIIKGITADVDFGESGIKNIEGSKLTIDVVPDLNSVGQKTLVAAYNKTAKGEMSKKTVIASATFEMVDKMYTCVGAINNTSPFGAEHSEAINVGSGETFVMTFTNYTDKGQNWNNFVIELFNADKSKFYATVRADNYGWGDGYAACTHSTDGHDADWASWLEAMDGAKVTTYITNNGNGTADIKAVMLGTDGKTYWQEYKGINTVDPDNLYFHLTIEKAHLEFDTVVGDESNTGPFGSAHSEAIHVPSGSTYVTRFLNYTDKGQNWNNFVVELFNADKTKFYATVRADNYGWGDGYAACTHSTDGHDADWASWLEAMDGAKVTTYITNNGDGTADVKAVMLGTDGKTYWQEYKGINTVDPDNLYFHLTMEKAHLVFE